MNARTARNIRAGIRRARTDRWLLEAFTTEVARDRLIQSPPSNPLAAAAYARTLTRLTRKATP